jgi:alanyl-tRNA synthetase
MTSDEIRKSFLQFFENKGHKIVPSSSLIPFDDPSLLFTNAGMVQFKKFWATNILLPYKKAVSCQRCVRAGGKDSDLEKIGYSARHHTFFEMLGNFSFGDYFKKETIEWAWEFVVNVLKIKPEQLWVSYYVEDEETKKIWKHFISEKRIVPLGKSHNFWGPAGNTGPCGPCSELYFDCGEEKSCGKPDCKPGCDCDRFLEFWNLVFPQYDQQIDGTYLDLKRRGVDTGMGLERISRIIQNTPTNYETDLFSPLIKKVEEISGINFSDKTSVVFRIIVDHIRAIVFLLSDGIIPENEGRGYVLRRILRRSAYQGKKLNISKPFLYLIAPSVIEIMSNAYPFLKENQTYLSHIIKEEEERFLILLDSSQKIFIQVEKSFKNNVIPGDILFKWYDTQGIPRDLIEEISLDKGFYPDWQEFEVFMEKQKIKSRNKSKFQERIEPIFISQTLKETIFTGYNESQTNTKVISFYYIPQKKLWQIVIEKTPLFPEKGGQIGDKGEIIGDNWLFKVIDTNINQHGIIFHTGEFFKGDSSDVKKNQDVEVKVSMDFRMSVSSNHTATHILHYCLREMLGKEIKQAGSYVGYDKLRFDFFYPGKIEQILINKIEDMVNSIILQNKDVIIEETDFRDAVSKGVIAHFLEKYGERVRIIDIGGFHKELCGGIHLKNTSQIEFFKILAFSSIGENVKRIEAATRKEAYNWIKEQIKILENLSHQFEVSSDQLVDYVEKLKKQIKEKDIQLQTFINKFISYQAEKILSDTKILELENKKVYIVSNRIDNFQIDILGRIADELSKKLENSISIFAGVFKSKVVAICKVNNSLSKLIPADKLLKKLLNYVDGSGGGNSLFAQGTGINIENIDEIFHHIDEIIKEISNNK